jgi:hypothetical protein
MFLLKSRQGYRDHGGSHSKNTTRMIMLKAKNTMRMTKMKVPHIAHFRMAMSQSPMVMSQSLVKRSLVKRYAKECRATPDEPERPIATGGCSIPFG